MTENKRDIKVTVEWFEELEEYLQPDELFESKEMYPSVTFLTPDGKKLVFYSHEILK